MKRITPTRDVHQDSGKDPRLPRSAIGYLVFDNDDYAAIFHTFKDAENFAIEESSVLCDEAVPILVYPLYAAKAIVIPLE